MEYGDLRFQSADPKLGQVAASQRALLYLADFS